MTGNTGREAPLTEG